MLDPGRLDVDEIATALSDQTDYEHRWLIDPRTGEVAFWTSDTGIDGENPVELDELDLVPIDPLPSAVWYADMADFAERISDDAAGRRLARAIRGKGAFRRFKDELFEEYPELVPAWRASVTLAPSVERSNGYSTKGSSRTMSPVSSWSTTRIPACLDDATSRGCTCHDLPTSARETGPK